MADKENKGKMLNKEDKEENEIVIDAENSVVGRLASFIAKQAIYGKSVVIVNSEKAKIIGAPEVIIEQFKARSRLGKGVQKGPLILKKPSELLRRAVRGMLERKRARGRAAFKRVKCYEQVPLQYENKKKLSVETKEAIKFITLGQLSKHLRGR